VSDKKILPYLMVAGAAVLWGCIGIFVEYLNDEGFSALEIVAYRVITATMILFLWMKIRHPDLLRIRPSDIRYFIGTGILSICFFNWCYFTAIRETSLSVAVVLLYTGPAFVVVLSYLFLKEEITKQKIAALVLTFAGICLVAELVPGGGEFTTFGILTGIGAGFGYALYSIFSKAALIKYPPLTIIFYTFLTASVFLLPFSGIFSAQTVERLSSPNNLLMIAGLGLLPTVLAYLLYTEGLNRIEAGKASITAMAEPVAAALIGVFIFSEVLTILQLTGMVLVLASVMLIQLRWKIGSHAELNNL
jgi:drug/metabolite transporter, DME family